MLNIIKITGLLSDLCFVCLDISVLGRALFVYVVSVLGSLVCLPSSESLKKNQIVNKTIKFSNILCVVVSFSSSLFSITIHHYHHFLFSFPTAIFKSLYHLTFEFFIIFYIFWQVGILLRSR